LSIIIFTAFPWEESFGLIFRSKRGFLGTQMKWRQSVFSLGVFLKKVIRKCMNFSDSKTSAGRFIFLFFLTSFTGRKRMNAFRERFALITVSSSLKRLKQLK